MPSPRIPAEADALGDLIAEFRLTTRTFEPLPARLAVVVGGMFACSGGFFLAGTSPRNTTALIMLLVGLGMILAAVGGEIDASVIRRTERVQVYRKGLVDLRRPRTTLLRWEDVEAVRQEPTPEQLEWPLYSCPDPVRFPIRTGMKARQHYCVMGRRGERLEYNSDTVQGVRALGNLIQAATTIRKIAAACREFEYGGTLDFQTLSLSRDGVTRGTETLPWPDVALIGFRDGEIIVQRRSPLQQKGASVAWLDFWLKDWAHVPIGQTDNIYVFAYLVRRMAGLMWLWRGHTGRLAPN